MNKSVQNPKKSFTKIISIVGIFSLIPVLIGVLATTVDWGLTLFGVSGSGMAFLREAERWMIGVGMVIFLACTPAISKSS